DRAGRAAAQLRRGRGALLRAAQLGALREHRRHAAPGRDAGGAVRGGGERAHAADRVRPRLRVLHALAGDVREQRGPGERHELTGAGWTGARDQESRSTKRRLSTPSMTRTCGFIVRAVSSSTWT